MRWLSASSWEKDEAIQNEDPKVLDFHAPICIKPISNSVELCEIERETDARLPNIHKIYTLRSPAKSES